jgi:hypothetical protein
MITREFSQILFNIFDILIEIENCTLVSPNLNPIVCRGLFLNPESRRLGSELREKGVRKNKEGWKAC